MLYRSRIPGWNWILQRVTALVLAVGLAGHFLVLHYSKLYAGGMLAAPDSTRSRFLGSPKSWLLFDGLLLAAGLFHALNGVYNIVADYDPGRGTKRILAWTLWAVGLASFALGIVLLGRFLLFARNG